MAWGGTDTAANRIRICTNIHRLAHTLLNAYKRLGGPPPWDYRRRFGPFVRDLAERGWAGLPAAARARAVELPDL